MFLIIPLPPNPQHRINHQPSSLSLCATLVPGLLRTSIPEYPFIFMHFCPEMTTQAESINSDLQRALDRRLRRTTLNTEQNQLAIKVSADN